MDYLITPALGGADDIHNLWPESSSATVWNAQVKDALEDHLRNLVCDGDLIWLPLNAKLRPTGSKPTRSTFTRIALWRSCATRNRARKQAGILAGA